MKKLRGFTLIEAIVSMGIFFIVFGAGMGTFIWAIKIQRYNLVYQKLIDQTSYALEYISRTIRMAKKDVNGLCITTGHNYDNPDANTIKFLNYKGECQEFSLNGSNQLAENKTGYSGPLPIISADFQINYINFIISGTGQPKVTISFEIQAANGDYRPKMRVQTTISQRDLDM